MGIFIRNVLAWRTFCKGKGKENHVEARGLWIQVEIPSNLPNTKIGNTDRKESRKFSDAVLRLSLMF
jgi:hypothetical protein